MFTIVFRPANPVRSLEIILLPFVFCSYAFLMSVSAGAQGYPAKTVRVVHGYAVGSAIDIFSRPLAQKLSEMTGQQFVIDARPGATGTIASEIVAKSLPDGYTLLAAPSSAIGSTPHLQKLTFDTLHDFAPIAQINEFYSVVVSHPSVPARNADELIKLAKIRPGYLTYGSTGVGSGFHLNFEYFCQGGFKFEAQQRYFAGVDVCQTSAQRLAEER